MLQVLNPKYSFVQFNEAVSNCDQRLPVVRNDDIVFQIKLQEGSDDAVIDTIITSGGSIDLVDEKLQVIKANAGTLEGKKISEHSAILYNADAIDVYAAGCFRLRISINGVNYYSNCFKFYESFKYSSTIEYSNKENSNDFVYCGWKRKNKIRLPFYLSKPKLKNLIHKTYVKSNGDIVLLESKMTKSFEGKTDDLVFDFLEKLKVALISDSVTVHSFRYKGTVVMEGDMDIDYPDEDVDDARATFELYAVPYNVRNSNCNTCP